VHDDHQQQRPSAVRATGSPDSDDPTDPIDPHVDPADPESATGTDRRRGQALPSVRNADPDPAMVREASEESFPASDPPTWTSSASTPKIPRTRPDDQSPS
jgi:hypothetical protein